VLRPLDHFINHSSNNIQANQSIEIHGILHVLNCPHHLYDTKSFSGCKNSFDIKNTVVFSAHFKTANDIMASLRKQRGMLWWPEVYYIGNATENYECPCTVCFMQDLVVVRENPDGWLVN